MKRIDRELSPFRDDSLLSRFQKGDLEPMLISTDFESIFAQAKLAEEMTNGSFTPFFSGKYDPTGLTKGWAIEQAFEKYLLPLLSDTKIIGVSLNGGGDLKAKTTDKVDFHWGIGIENPDDLQMLLTSYYLKNGAVATSGSSKRGENIVREYNSLIKQVTIVSDSLVDADIWATAGIASGYDKFSLQIKRFKLSGLMVVGSDVINFKEGVIANAEKTPL